MNKIMFLQPSYAHYRETLFSLLDKEFDIKFVFMSAGNTYPGEIDISNISYEIIENQYSYKWLGLIISFLKKKPDIIISSVSTSLRSIIAFLYAFVFRKKMILWIEEWKSSNCHQKGLLKCYAGLVRKFIGKLLIIRSDALVVGGTAAKRHAISLGKREKEIFMSMQCSDDIAKKGGNYTVTNGGYNFLYLSRIIELKGLDILIRAFALLRKERADVSLTIAGDGEFAQFCRKLCRSMKLQDVVFAGAVIPSDRNAFFQQADVFVLPGKFLGNFYEAWGLVINEALSMGLPIITTNAVGAAHDLVFDDQNGFIVRENSVLDLYRAMKKIFHCDLYAMSQKSREIFDNKNDFERMAQGFNDAIFFVKNK